MADIAAAEAAILRFTQASNFEQKRIHALQLNKHVQRNSTIYRLDPKLQGGIIRVVGRLTKFDGNDVPCYPAKIVSCDDAHHS